MLLGKKKGDALTDRVTGAGEQLSDSVSGAYRLWYEKLVQAVRLAMPPECPYVVVSASDLVGVRALLHRRMLILVQLFSCIFVKQSEYDGLRDIASIRVKTGLGGRYGNKGGIITRFVMDDTSLLFTNVHLAAGQRNRRARDRDLVDILEDKSTFSSLNSSSPGAYAAGGSGLSVFDHEICIISGDLNYRIDERRDVVLAAVEQGGLKGLLAQDQLLKGLATNQNFRLRSFKEAPLTFSPTYKYAVPFSVLQADGHAGTTRERTTTTRPPKIGFQHGAIECCTALLARSKSSRSATNATSATSQTIAPSPLGRRCRSSPSSRRNGRRCGPRWSGPGWAWRRTFWTRHGYAMKAVEPRRHWNPNPVATFHSCQSLPTGPFSCSIKRSTAPATLLVTRSIDSPASTTCHFSPTSFPIWAKMPRTAVWMTVDS